MLQPPSLQWLQLRNQNFLELPERDGRRWWRVGKDTVSLQILPGGLKEGVDSGSMEALREMVQPKSADGSSILTFRVIEVGWLSGLELVLKVPRSPGDTFTGQVHFPFPDFTYLLELECAEFLADPPRFVGPTPAELGADFEDYLDNEDYYFGWQLDRTHPYSRLTDLLRGTMKALWISAELRWLQQVPLPCGEIVEGMSIETVFTEERFLKDLPSLVGQEMGKFILPSMKVETNSGAVWFPACSIPVGGRYLIVKGYAPQSEFHETVETALDVWIKDSPYEVSVDGEYYRNCIPMEEASTLAISTKPLTIERLQLYERQSTLSAQRHLLVDAALVIGCTDGTEILLHATRRAPEVDLHITPEVLAYARTVLHLRWDSQWVLGS